MIHTRSFRRKTAPGVKGGKVVAHTRVAPTPTYWNTPQSIPVIDKQDPGKGFRHFLTRRDFVRFIEILPAWDELSKGLDAVVLAAGEAGGDGYYTRSVVALHAWERDMWRMLEPPYYFEHKEILTRLRVPCVKSGGEYQCRFTPDSIKGFQLLHVFLHELGHHHDLMTSRRKVESGRGESYAEKYARQYEDLLWHRYQDKFGI